jgi:hypothetical protein
MTDAQGTDPGFNLTYGLDVYPSRPFVISASIDVGTLGRTFLFHGRVSVGLCLGPVELYGGYDVLHVDPVAFHGPIGGMRMWF